MIEPTWPGTPIVWHDDQEVPAMPHLPLIIAVAAAILIVVGRVGRRLPVAIAGFALLAVAGLLVLLEGSA